MSMSAHARFLLMGIWCECDDQGVFEWKPVVLKAKLLPADDVIIVDLLAELENQNCIRKFEVGGRAYGAVRNFCRYQRPKKPNSTHPLPNSEAVYVGKFSTGGEPVPPDDGSGGEKSPQMEDGGGKKEEVKKQPPPPITPPAPDAPASAVGGRVAGEKRASWSRFIDAASRGFEDAGFPRPWPAANDSVHAQALEAMNADVEVVRWTVEAVTRQVMAKDPKRRPPDSLAYMIDAIRRNVAAPPPECKPVEHVPDAEKRINRLKLLLADGKWFDGWGVRPTEDEARAELNQRVAA